MNAAERGIYLHEFILYFRWNLLDHHTHLNCSSFVYLHLHIFSHFEFIKKFLEIICHSCFRSWVLREKLIDMCLLFNFFLKIFFILFLFSLIFFIKGSSDSFLRIEMTPGRLLSLMNDSILKNRYPFKKTTILMFVLWLMPKKLIKKLIINLKLIILE